MKKILTGFMLLISMVSFAQTQVAEIIEKGSNRKITYMQDQDSNQLIFTLHEGEVTEVLKKLKYSADGNTLELAGDQNVYSFNFFKRMKDVAEKMYYNNCEYYLGLIASGTTSVGMIAMVAMNTGLGFPIAGGTAVLACGGAPIALGVLGLPIEAVIGVGDKILDKDARAARKFSKLVSGKGNEASTKVFISLIEQIKKL
jgi:hypothetical protein